MTATAPAVETTALTKRFGRHRGIEDVTLTVRAGEVFGFLGPNGAGKTTMIRTLLGLLAPTAGRARVLGLDPHRDGVRVRERVGNLPAEFAFDDGVTGAGLLDLLGDLRGLGDRTRATALAERFDADLTRPMGDLSRGNRQKIGIVQALAHRPALVFMDEPTAGLDPLMQEEFERLVGELRDEGTTVFLSSHNLTEVDRLCDRVGVIRNGRLVAEEAIGDLPARAARRVVIEFASPEGAQAVAALPGATTPRVDGCRVTVTFTGALDDLLAAAAHHPVVDLEVSRPTLEETFRAFYDDRPDAGDG